MEDVREFARRAMAGDMDAFANLVTRFEDMAVGYAYAKLGDYHLAEDVSQEAFIEAFRSMHTLRDPAAFPAWLKTIIGFRCNRILRKPSLRTDPLDDSVALADTASNPELLVVRRDETSLVWQAVRQLPEQDRVIVTLYYLQEYTHQQIASFLGIPASRVNNRLHASRKKLQKELLAMFGDEMAQMKPSRDDQFRRTVIEGVMPISHAQTNYSMLCHFGVSLLAAVSVLGCETDYPTIMGASGMAFRMVWIAGWHMEIDDVLQMADDPYEPIRRAFGALGYRYRIRHCTDPVDYPRYYPATHPLWVTRREAAQEIRHSIDHGIPVIAFGVTGSLLASLVTGYEDNGEVLLGLNADDGGENSDEVMPSGFFKKEDWYPHTAAYILIGEQTDLVPRRRRYLDAVRYAVQLARTPQMSGIYRGLAAYTAWARQLTTEDFASLPLHGQPGEDYLMERFIVHCNGLCMLNERSHAATFLERIAAEEPDIAEELHAAATYYRKASEYAGALWAHVSMDDAGVQRFAAPEIRSILADHVLHARDLEEMAVSSIESLLGRIMI